MGDTGGERHVAYGASSFKFQRESLRIFDTFGAPTTTFPKECRFYIGFIEHMLAFCCIPRTPSTLRQQHRPSASQASTRTLRQTEVLRRDERKRAPRCMGVPCSSPKRVPRWGGGARARARARAPRRRNISLAPPCQHAQGANTPFGGPPHSDEYITRDP